MSEGLTSIERVKQVIPVVTLVVAGGLALTGCVAQQEQREVNLSAAENAEPGTIGTPNPDAIRPTIRPKAKRNTTPTSIAPSVPEATIGLPTPEKPKRVETLQEQIGAFIEANTVALLKVYDPKDPTNPNRFTSPPENNSGLQEIKMTALDKKPDPDQSYFAELHVSKGKDKKLKPESVTFFHIEKRTLNSASVANKKTGSANQAKEGYEFVLTSAGWVVHEIGPEGRTLVGNTSTKAKQLGKELAEIQAKVGAMRKKVVSLKSNLQVEPPGFNN